MRVPLSPLTSSRPPLHPPAASHCCRSPQVNPELEGPTLPSKSDEEFRPFVRRLPEFKFWWSSVRALAVGLAATLFPMLDVPVFWPILLLYW